MWDEPDFRLDALDPRAQIAVITDVKIGESIFTTGDGLRQNWEDPQLQRVHQLPTPKSVSEEFPWNRCLCPDGSTLFIKFLSPEYRLLDEDTSKPNDSTTDMPEKETTTKKSPPPRKPSKAPAKPVKPVAAQKSNAKTKPVKAPKPEGNYKWLLHRLKAQATAELSTGDNRSTIREGLKTANSFGEVRSFLERAGVTDDQFFTFLGSFFNASINRPLK